MVQKYQKKINYIGLLVFIACFFLALRLTESIFVIIPMCIGLILAMSPMIFNIDHILVIINICLVILIGLDAGKILPSYLNLKYSLAFSPLIMYFSINKIKISPEEVAMFISIPILGLIGSIPTNAIALLTVITSLVCLMGKEVLRSIDLENKYYSYYSRSSKEKYHLEKLYKSLNADQNDRIENAILSERNRISRDIHDGLGHLTSRAILQLGAMIVLERDPLKKEALNDIKKTLSEGMVEVRKSLHNLQSESIDLKSEVEKLIADFSFCRVNLSFGLTSEFDMSFKYSILYIIKEALTNVAKHSNASRVDISLVEMKERVYLKISDNGKNIPADTGGMGIFSIRKRIEELGGQVKISTKDGFRIFANIYKKF